MSFSSTSLTAKDSDNSSLHILMVVPQYPYPVVGGLERQAHELAKTLLKYGVDVQVLSGKVHPSQNNLEEVEGVSVYRIPWSSNKWVRFVRAPFDVMYVLLSKRNMYNVVHLHQYSWFGLFVILASKILRKPVLTKLPNDGPYGLLTLENTHLGWLKLIIVKMSDAFVAMTEATLIEIEAIGFPCNRVLFSPNGIKVTDRNKIKIRSKNDDVCRVVFVGGLREQKGVEDLLYAWHKLISKSKVKVQLELWGEGPLEKKLKFLTQNLNIDDSVLFIGHVDSVREKLKDMNIFVLSSLGEGNSNAILEAMDAGLPIVCTRVGGAILQLGPKGTRYIVEPGDRDRLCDCLLELVENVHLRNEIGDVMRERVLNYFDIHKVAESYISAYTYLITGKRSRISELSIPIMNLN